MAEAGREAEVYLRLNGADLLVGRFFSHRGRVEFQTFTYDPAYLTLPGAYEIDPALPFEAATHQTAVGQATFGAFADCIPDRWGQRLIERAERLRAKREGRTQRSFGAADLLLGVRDDMRQGALRFRAPDGGEFLAPEAEGAPPFLRLSKLLGAAERLESEDDEEALGALLRDGSSLGGARPKAHVLAPDGRVSIAKFPAPAADDWDVIRWETVALRLAAAAGIEVPRNELHTIDGRSVLLVERFDRRGAERIGYLSAMTMLGRADRARGSYLEIAEAITRNSPQAGADLRQLWRRVAFGVLISNLDDHLRNHGFLRTSSAGWTLSPAFDLNPDPRPGERLLATEVDVGEPDARLEPLLELAEWFRLDPEQALAALAEVKVAVAEWRRLGAELGADRDELELLAPAFEHEAADEAKVLLND